MSRWIDADAVMNGIKASNLGEWYVGRIDGKSEEVIPTETVYRLIDKAPSIDIVFCKECKFYRTNIPEVGGKYNGCVRWLDNGNEIEVNADDFCSYGERRE